MADTERERPGNPLVETVLGEIADRLRSLADQGTAGVIDLHSLPLAPQQRLDLQQRLGRGEVAASLDVAGGSEVWETRYPGVWWVRHVGAGDRIAVERIEITAIPEILVAPREDLARQPSADLAET